jgi:hypothetical protein
MSHLFQEAQVDNKDDEHQASTGQLRAHDRVLPKELAILESMSKESLQQGANDTAGCD